MVEKVASKYTASPHGTTFGIRQFRTIFGGANIRDAAGVIPRQCQSGHGADDRLGPVADGSQASQSRAGESGGQLS